MEYEEEEEKNKLINISFNFANNIFDNLTNNKYTKLKFTLDSIYSSSKITGSNRLIDIILKTVNRKDIVITDGTANIGTDTIKLANTFSKVNSIEISKLNFEALKNNTSVLNDKKNINLYNGDTNKIIKSLKQDIIYIDAPWGGRNYKENDKMKLYLGDVEIMDFYLNNKDRAEYFIFKIPYNYDFNYLTSKISDNIKIHSFKKDSVIKYYILVIERVKDI